MAPRTWPCGDRLANPRSFSELNPKGGFRGLLGYDNEKQIEEFVEMQIP